MNSSGRQSAKRIMRKNKVGRISLFNCKTYITTLVKTVRYLYKVRCITQWRGIENS